MPLPILSALVIIFILWLQYEIRKSSKKSDAASASFWEKEAKSNLVRRVDISTLNYLTIWPEQLPLEDNKDETINSYRDIILGLVNKKIINLSRYNNTDLKNKYGAANLPQLQEYDNNYTILISILQKWAERLYHQGDIQGSKAILEYAVGLRSDAANTYRLLAEIYKAEKIPEKINHLIQTIPELNIYEQDKLIADLKALKHF